MLAFLSGLAGAKSTLNNMVVQNWGVHFIVSIAPRMDEASGTNISPHSVLGLMMTGMEHEFLTNF